MQSGLFGKLPGRRDFIAVRVQRAFLEAWEPWMQSCLIASQEMLEGDWHRAYRAAPIWRFWLSADVCGEATLGAMMPSFDGVGRAYPLTLLLSGNLAAPECDAREGLFMAIETVLRSTADGSLDYAEVLVALGALARPIKAWQGRYAPIVSCEPQIGDVNDAPADWPRRGGSVALGQWANCVFPNSVWWTAGNASHRAHRFVTPHLPDPGLFTAMITGSWPVAPEAG
jgi:type VI secretion system protein ImpM